MQIYRDILQLFVPWVENLFAIQVGGAHKSPTISPFVDKFVDCSSWIINLLHVLLDVLVRNIALYWFLLVCILTSPSKYGTTNKNVQIYYPPKHLIRYISCPNKLGKGRIQNLLYGFRENVSCTTKRIVPSGQDSAILPVWVANHSTGYDSSCPLTKLALC